MITNHSLLASETAHSQTFSHTDTYDKS